MSRLPSMVQSPWAPLVSVLHLLRMHKQVVAAAGLLVVAAVLLVANWPQGGAGAIVSTASGAASAVSHVASESAAAVEVVMAKPATVQPAAPVAQVVASAVSVPAPVASAPNKVASAPSPMPIAHAASCAYSTEPLPQLTPMVASKPGRYVHFVSSTNVELCVVDGNKQITSLTLKAGESRSIYGASPWQVPAQAK